MSIALSKGFEKKIGVVTATVTGLVRIWALLYVSGMTINVDQFKDLRQRVLIWQPGERTAASCSRVGTVESPAVRITSIADKFMPILEEQTKLTAKTTEENRECKKMMETRTDYYLEKALADLRSCSQWSGERSSRQTQFPWTRPCYVCGRHGHYARESIKNHGRVYNRRVYAQQSATSRVGERKPSVVRSQAKKWLAWTRSKKRPQGNAL